MGVWGLGNRVKLAVILTLSDSEGEESLSDRIYSFLLSIFEEVHAKSKTRCGRDAKGSRKGRKVENTL
jgi:hypothetical protein